MSGLDSLIQHYIAVWNETDTAARRRSVEQVWAPGARHIDPLVVAQGHDAIDATTHAGQAQFPGLVMRLARPGSSRWCWAPTRSLPLPEQGITYGVSRRSSHLTLTLGFPNSTAELPRADRTALLLSSGS